MPCGWEAPGGSSTLQGPEALPPACHARGTKTQTPSPETRPAEPSRATAEAVSCQRRPPSDIRHRRGCFLLHFSWQEKAVS